MPQPDLPGVESVTLAEVLASIEAKMIIIKMDISLFQKGTKWDFSLDEARIQQLGELKQVSHCSRGLRFHN